MYIAKKYFCQGDGAQWNIQVEVTHSFEGLHVVRAGAISDLVGYTGNDGYMYALVPDCDLYDKPQD